MNSEISMLLPKDVSRLQEQREIVAGYLDGSQNLNFDTVANKLSILQAILDASVIKSDETYALQSLGVVFGDALVQELNLEWAIIEDEYGRDPAVIHLQKMVKVFPLTMISKRIEDGYDVDVRDLFVSTADLVNEEIEAAAAR